MPDKLQQLYDALSKDEKYSGVGATYDSFVSAMSDPSVNKKVYEALSVDENYSGVGSTYESFIDGFGLKKKRKWFRSLFNRR